jgi:hypothetical protein
METVPQALAATQYNAGVVCSDGMVDRTLAAQWASVDAAFEEAEKRRQALEKERNRELTTLVKAAEGRRQEVADATAAKKRILDEMRVVRNKMEDKVVSARGLGNRNMGGADRALARAGKNALTARGDSERWQARAKDVEITFAGRAAREADVASKTKEAIQNSTADFEADLEARLQLGQRLVGETREINEQLSQRHQDHCLTQETHAQQSAALNMQGADGARQDAVTKVQTAVAKSSKEQMAYINDIQRSRQVAAAKVAKAQQDFLEQRRECEATLDRERTCAAQARKIAMTLKMQQQEETDAEISKLQAKLDFTTAQAQLKVANFASEAEVSTSRNEAWDARIGKSQASAQVRAATEEESAAGRVNQAKISLAKLQERCAAYLRNLQDLWQEAKKEDAMKVDAATARTEEITRLCEETLRSCEKYCSESLRNTENHAQSKKVQLEDKVAEMDDLAKQRVAMMQRQSKERRKRAETQLADFLAHVEQVQTQCAERVRTEEATADEKVEMARQRFESEVELAERRQREAEARRDAARASHAAVMARCIGSSMEARRRGLNNIAEVIEPEPPKRYPGWDAPAKEPAALEAGAESMLASSFTMSSAVEDLGGSNAVAGKDGFANTGLTGASTAAPDDLMDSMATTQGGTQEVSSGLGVPSEVPEEPVAAIPSALGNEATAEQAAIS